MTSIENIATSVAQNHREGCVFSRAKDMAHRRMGINHPATIGWGGYRRGWSPLAISYFLGHLMMLTAR